MGNVSAVTTTLPAGMDQQAFCYDEQDRLTWASSASGPGPCGGTNTAGTLTAASYTQTFAYDTLNRLTFTSADTVDAGGLNRYAYVGDNPETKTDPSGHCIPLCTMIAGTLAGIVIGGGISLISQVKAGHGVNWGTVAQHAAVGAAVGFVAGATLGVGLAVAGTGIAASMAVLAEGGTAVAAATAGVQAAGWYAAYGVTLGAVDAAAIANAEGDAAEGEGVAAVAANGATNAVDRARFVVNSDGVVSDTAPDLPGLARMHAEELIARGGNVPRAAAAAVDTATWNPYFGESGSLPEQIDPELAARFPDPSLENWPSGNCAEFAACNTAVVNGASIDDMMYSTAKIGRAGIEPFPACLNCQVILKGARGIPW